MASAKRGSAAPFKSLQYFLNRSQVLAQYREFLRITQPLEAETRRDVRQQIRAAYEMYRNIQDDKQVSMFVRQGKDQLKHVSDLVDSAVARQRLANEQAAAAAKQKASDTWTEEGDDSQDDVKGRMGTGWPWKKADPKKIELEGIRRR